MDTVPGAKPVGVGIYDERDILLDAFETIDNRLDDLVGIRPLIHIARGLTTIAPANVVRNVTGIQKPSELVEGLENRVESDLSSKKMLGGLPPLPKPY